jgi:hypothetical protein
MATLQLLNACHEKYEPRIFSMLLSLRSIAVLTLLSLTALAQAASIVGLKNTGADSASGSQDLNYALVGSPTTALIIGGYGWDAASINAAWDSNNAISQWLTPEQDGNASLDPTVSGFYTWKLKFDLTGFDSSTASFSARYRTDNAGTVSLNGTNLGANITDPQSYSSSVPWMVFTALSPLFVAGVNELTFTVQNDFQPVGNPSGIRVEFVSSMVSAVPEPEGLILAVAGICLFSLSSATNRRKLNRLQPAG